MKNILEAKFMIEAIRTLTNLYRLGWDERNGGNISYLLDEEEFAKNMEIVYGDLVWGENYDLSFPRGNYYFGDLEGDYE